MFSKGFRNPSVMSHNFSEVPHANIPRSSFRRAHGHKTAFDSGYLIPIYVDEALPGDTFNLNLTSIARLATPEVPVMDNMYMDYFFFFVPNRLIWDNWQRFMGEQTSPGASTDFVVPQIAPTTTWQAETLADYFGLPVGVDVDVNSLHFRAYNLIYNEWFRDQNLQDAVTVDTDDGPDAEADYVLLRRGKRHDYFTSCLPWPQKGDAIDLPLGDTAPVITNASEHYTSGSASPLDWRTTGGANPNVSRNMGIDVNGFTSTDSTAFNGVQQLVPSNLYADLSNATAATINSLREAFQLQRMLERDARGGTRYTEILQSHFRVTSPDARLQRPEYLGGGSRPVDVEAIPQTSQTATTPQATLAGLGYQQSHGIGFTKSFVEHGVIIGLASVRADLTYQQGLSRMWSRQTKYDFYWPALAHLGEQEVLSKEIYSDGTVDDNLVFGYQERWAEYRYKPSLITGKLRSNHAQSLDVWHLSQEFGARPTLNSAFIQETPPIDRIIATTNEPEFIFDGYFDVVTARPMPTYSVPGLIDHF